MIPNGASMPQDPEPIAVRRGEGRAMQGPVGGALELKVTGRETGGRMTALENIIAPGEGPPLHTHDVEDESWYVIEGTLRFQLGSELAEAPAGTFVFVPRGVPHAFQNVDTSPARILVMFSPSGMERFFESFAALPSGTDPAPAFAQIGATVGMTVVGPPLR
jgi:quercetin dioxygenase-like cupin family protein